VLDHIKYKPSPELDLILAIKYGKFQRTEEWLQTLPQPVVDAVVKEFDVGGVWHLYWGKHERIKCIIVNFRGDAEVESAIHEALTKYHSLLGTV